MEISERTQKWSSGFIAVVLAFTLIFGFYQFAVQGDRFAALAAILLVVAAVPWYLSLYAGRIELFEPILFHSIFFAMLIFGWIERVYINEPELLYEFISRSFANAFFFVGGVLAVLFSSTIVGYYLLGPTIARWLSDLGQKVQTVFGMASSPSGTVFRVLAGFYLLAGVISILGTVLFVFPTNEILYLYVNTVSRSQTFSGNGVFILLSRAFYIGYLLWLCGAVVDDRTPSLIEFALAIPITGAFLITGARGRALSVVVIAVVFFYYTVIEDVFSLDRGRLSKLTNYVPPIVLVFSLPIIGLGVALIVVLTGIIRSYQSLSESLTSIDPFSILTAGISTDVYDNFLGLMEFVPERIGYFYGLFYARVPLNFIPRSIWPEKPVSTSGGVFRRIAFPEESGGLPPGAMGEYYLNFGLLGIPLMGAFYGVLLYLTWRLIKVDDISVISLTIFTLLLVSIGKNGLTNNILFALASEFILLIPAVAFLIGWGFVSTSTSRNWQFNQQ